MFSIKPAIPEDYYDIKEVFEKYNKKLELKPNMYIMVAREDGFSGIGVFEMFDSYAILTDILMADDDNWEMKFFVVKSVLNSIDLKGVKDVYSTLDKEEKVLRMCKFQKNDEGKFHVNLEGYFVGGCSCEK